MIGTRVRKYNPIILRKMVTRLNMMIMEGRLGRLRISRRRMMAIPWKFLRFNLLDLAMRKI